MPLTFFDIAAGAILIISAVIGWTRGATREVLSVGALVISAITGVLALRYSGPIARHAIHTVWMANIAAILIVCAVTYVILRLIAGWAARSILKTNSFGAVDRAVGAGFGAGRALVVLGLANLTLSAIMPPDRMPGWISGSYLYPVSQLSAQALKSFAPKGAALARRVGPAVGRAITDTGDDDAGPDADTGDQNRDYNGAHKRALTVRREQPS
jgi:membrane protein required for colicin V production